jgi:hypothetical protein
VKSPLPPPPRRDAQTDAQRVVRVQRMERRVWGGIAAVIAQCFLSLIGGGWAAASSAPAWSEAMPLGAVGMVFALGLAWAAVSILRMLGFLAALPRLLRFVFSRPAPSRLASSSSDPLWMAATYAIHGATLVAAAVVLTTLLYAVAGAAWWPTLARFLAVVVLVSLLTPRAERVIV